ncbi:hypothetical protein JHK84_043127 [Glycine max]|nr:hypothetical protein JHK87_042852 [Glycine soja]KAG4949691.1 hypothetical protein JHK86_042930 [Glycine max]KAG4957177.1 hypothetical protein JHK85_043557 [Glycine max]KAG5117014.1 hypothetical protein JHK84_043127 [Glycine max]
MVRSRMDKMQAICTTNKHSDEAWFLWKWRKLFGIQHNNLSSSDQSAVSDFAKKGGSDTKIETEEGEACDLEKKMETQSKELWDLKDDLKKHVTTTELREMLEANGQDSSR